MGQAVSSAIEELHNVVALPDEGNIERKVEACMNVQKLAKDDTCCKQIVEEGGLHPILQLYEHVHPTVKVEAATGIGLLAENSINQEIIVDNGFLPQLIAPILSAELPFQEKAVLVLANLAQHKDNKLPIVKEGVLGMLIGMVTSESQELQNVALLTLSRLCENDLVASMVGARNGLVQLLRAARTDDDRVKLGVVRVMANMAQCASNMSTLIRSGSLIFLFSCSRCNTEIQHEVARCLANFLQQVFEGNEPILEKEAMMLSSMSSIHVNSQMIKEEDVGQLDIKSASQLSMAELIPDLMRRTKKMLNCDRATIFMLSPDRTELNTILAHGTSQITVPLDSGSIAGECIQRGMTLNIPNAYKHATFNPEIDRKTGYRTKTMLVMPIRSVHSAETIGVVQAINKNKSEAFNKDDERFLHNFCHQAAAVLEKVQAKKVKTKGRHAGAMGDNWIENISMMAQMDIMTLIKIVLERTRDMVAADRASLFIYDKKRHELWSKIADNTPEIRVKANTGIIGAVATSGHGVNIVDAYKDKRFNRKIDAATGYRTRSILCLPVKNSTNQVVAVIQCINKVGGERFTLEDENKVKEFSFQCAAVIDQKAAALNKLHEKHGSKANEANAAAGMTDDCAQSLLFLTTSNDVNAQIEATRGLSYMCLHPKNQERVVQLGGMSTLYSLTTPYPWRNVDLLRISVYAVANITVSEPAREMSYQHGGWTSLIRLARSSDEKIWFDATRAIANLSLHPRMQERLVQSSVLKALLVLCTKKQLDVQVQSIRALGNLSLNKNCQDAFEREKVLDTLLKVSKTMSPEVTCELANTFSKMSTNDTTRYALFQDQGVAQLLKFLTHNGIDQGQVLIHLADTVANCLVLTSNQHVLLGILDTPDVGLNPDGTRRELTTEEQRKRMQEEREAIQAGEDIRNILAKLADTTDPHVLREIARGMETMSMDKGNHIKMDAEEAGYVSMVVKSLSTPDVQVNIYSCRSLKNICAAEEIEEVRERLLGLQILPPLIKLINESSDSELKIEAVTVMRVLAMDDRSAGKMVNKGALDCFSGKSPDGAKSDKQNTGLVFTTEVKMQIITCQALQEFARNPNNKLRIAKAGLVPPLINMAHSPNQDVSIEACKVLQFLA